MEKKAKTNKFQQIYTKDERIGLIHKNKLEIKRALKSVDKDTLKLYEKVIDEAAQYATSLSEINAIIARDGFVDSYQNGENQYGTKKSVAAELKPKYTQTYQTLIKQLSELLPTEGEKDAAAELMDFINDK